MTQEQTEALLLPDERLDEVNEQIRLIQKRQGLTFGTDAYLLSAFVRPQPRDRAVDLGSGTGIIPLLLCAKNKVRSVTAVELQPDFASLITRNAELNGFSSRITSVNADVRTLTAASIGGEVGLVVSNPPYLKTGTGKTSPSLSKELARHEVCGGIAEFCAAASRILRTKGRFVCVFRAERLTDLFTAMRENRLEPKRMITVHSDSHSAPCAVLTEAVKDASPSLSVLPPLFLYEDMQTSDSRRKMTARAAEIYRTCSFPVSGKER